MSFSNTLSMDNKEDPAYKSNPGQTLIWAVSCMFDNRNIFEFKAVHNIDDRPHLSFILQHAYHDDGSEKGLGYVLDEHYEPEYAVGVTNDLSAFNMHEFNILDGGKSALACLYRPEYMDLGDLGRLDEQGWVMTGGFVELDVATGAVLYEWSSVGHIPIHESVTVNSWDSPSGQPGWDYVHVNAVDKNEAGDYILSARFTNNLPHFRRRWTHYLETWRKISRLCAGLHIL